MELLNDFGHGRNTYPPSKGVPGLPEFEFNNAVGKEVKRLLSGKIPTFEAQPFDTDEVPLRTRTNLYNARHAKDKTAIGISNHANANKDPNVRGFGVFFWHDSAPARRLAGLLLEEYKKEFPDRKKYPIWGNGLFPSVPGTWTDLHMTRETNGVFVLVEWEFMTNPEALKLLQSDEYRKRCAKVEAKAVSKWYSVPFIEVKAAVKEEIDMLEKAIVINAFPDFPLAELLAARIKAPIYTRAALPTGKVANELYVVGGSPEGLQAEKIIPLTGNDRFAVARAVEEFLK